MLFKAFYKQKRVIGLFVFLVLGVEMVVLAIPAISPDDTVLNYSLDDAIAVVDPMQVIDIPSAIMQSQKYLARFGNPHIFNVSQLGVIVDGKFTSWGLAILFDENTTQMEITPELLLSAKKGTIVLGDAFNFTGAAVMSNKTFPSRLIKAISHIYPNIEFSVYLGVEFSQISTDTYEIELTLSKIWNQKIQLETRMNELYETLQANQFKLVLFWISLYAALALSFFILLIILYDYALRMNQKNIEILFIRGLSVESMQKSLALRFTFLYGIISLCLTLFWIITENAWNLLFIPFAVGSIAYVQTSLFVKNPSSEPKDATDEEQHWTLYTKASVFMAIFANLYNLYVLLPYPSTDGAFFISITIISAIILFSQFYNANRYLMEKVSSFLEKQDKLPKFGSCTMFLHKSLSRQKTSIFQYVLAGIIIVMVLFSTIVAPPNTHIANENAYSDLWGSMKMNDFNRLNNTGKYFAMVPISLTRNDIQREGALVSNASLFEVHPYFILNRVFYSEPVILRPSNKNPTLDDRLFFDDEETSLIAKVGNKSTTLPEIRSSGEFPSSFQFPNNVEFIAVIPDIFFNLVDPNIYVDVFFSTADIPLLQFQQIVEQQAPSVIWRPQPKMDVVTLSQQNLTTPTISRNNLIAIVIMLSFVFGMIYEEKRHIFPSLKRKGYSHFHLYISLLTVLSLEFVFHFLSSITTILLTLFLYTTLLKNSITSPISTILLVTWLSAIFFSLGKSLNFLVQPLSRE